MIVVLQQRKTYVLAVALLLYVWSSIWLMTTSFTWIESITQAAIWMMISLVVMTLLAIEYQDVYIRELLPFVGWGFLVQGILWSGYFLLGNEVQIWWSPAYLFKLISLAIFHGSIAYVLWTKHRFLRYRAMYGLWILLTTGLPVYVMSLALAIAFGIGASFRPITIDCNAMAHGVDTFVANVLPYRKSAWTPALPSSPSASWDTFQQLRWAITQKVSVYKTMMIDDLIAQKSFLDEKVCGTIVEQLRALADLPWVRLSVVLLLFLLLWPFLAIYGRLVGGIGVLFVYLLMRGGIYKRTARHVLWSTLK
jgi:hypothetical protein